MKQLNDLDSLRDKTLDLIDEYNKDENHRTVRPIQGYGNPLSEIPMRAYWAHWDDDQRSTSMIGLMYLEDKLHAVGSTEALTLEEAIDNFKDQLKNIPLR